MIIAVSMNPSVDKTLNLSELKPGYLNRIESVVLTAGGKGLNVANNVAAFTNDLVVTGFLGIHNKGIILNSIKNLEDRGVKIDFVSIDDRNRTNIKVIEESGRLTEINEPGFNVSEEKVTELMGKLNGYAGEGNLFILTGSVPKGVGSDIYKILTASLKAQGSKVIVDADGELLKNAIESKPDAIKPNEQELLALFGEKSISEKLVISKAKELVDKGIETVIVSRGEKGSIFVRKDSIVKCNIADVDMVSTVGAGDAMTAVFSYGLIEDIDYHENIKRSVAASSFTVSLETPYFTSIDEVEKLKNQIILEKI